MTGSTNSFGAGSYDVFLAKADSIGNIAWMKTYGSGGDDIGNSVQQTSDGGYIVAGNMGLSSLYIIRTNSTGDTLWTRTLNGAVGYDATQTSDGGYIVTGEILTFGTNTIDAYLIKMNSSGDTTWTHHYGGTATDLGRSVIQLADGGYAIAGATGSLGAGSNDACLMRTDASGNALWCVTYGGPNSEIAYMVKQTADKGYILGGYTNSFGAGLNDIYLIRTDTGGVPLWSKTFGDTLGEFGYSVAVTADGGYIIAGSSQSYGSGGADMYVIKTDNTGSSGCNENSPTTLYTSTDVPTLNLSKAMNASGSVSTHIALTIRGGITTPLCGTSTGVENNGNKGSLMVFPDPSDGHATILFPERIESGTLAVYDAFGRNILDEKIEHAAQQEINISIIPSGIYFISVTDGRDTYKAKWLVQ